MNQLRPVNPASTTELQGRINDFKKRGSNLRGKQQSTLGVYWQWLLCNYSHQIIDTVGDLEFTNPELVPVALLQGVRDEEEPWNLYLLFLSFLFLFLTFSLSDFSSFLFHLFPIENKNNLVQTFLPFPFLPHQTLFTFFQKQSQFWDDRPISRTSIGTQEFNFSSLAPLSLHLWSFKNEWTRASWKITFPLWWSARHDFDLTSCFLGENNPFSVVPKPKSNSFPSFTFTFPRDPGSLNAPAWSWCHLGCCTLPWYLNSGIRWFLILAGNGLNLNS